MVVVMDAIVTGAGGFVGGHLVAALVATGRTVRAVDRRPPGDWFQRSPAAENLLLDVSLLDGARLAVRGASEVYNLAADMGGMGFIEQNKAACMLNVLSSTHVLKASHEAAAERYFYSSSACVYPARLQDAAGAAPLREEDAYPADPEDGYGWEKLFGERMCRHFHEDYGLATRVARYHNVYGELGTYEGARAKAPAAICRKVAIAKVAGRREIEIWGDGRQTRTFTYIDDCIEGTLLVALGDDPRPVNIGSSDPVSIDELTDLVQEIAGIRLRRRYVPGAPQGVRGRSSDNSEVLARYNWEPKTSLAEGLERTYRWVYDQVMSRQT
jgi:nucleoside-diphosphate-sugar epimerase